jgi:hypothetical protein
MPEDDFVIECGVVQIRPLSPDTNLLTALDEDPPIEQTLEEGRKQRAEQDALR